jgi:hypothetical protein
MVSSTFGVHLSPKGSPSAANLRDILAALQKNEGVRFELALKR